MSLRSEPLVAGALRGTIYTFENADDSLPLHDHVPETAHITFVARGPVRCHSGDGAWELVGETGALWDLGTGPHEFVGMAPGTKIVNIIKGVST